MPTTAKVTKRPTAKTTAKTAAKTTAKTRAVTKTTQTARATTATKAPKIALATRATKTTKTAKTVPTGADVAAYLDARATPAQRPDCDTLVALCARVTGEPAVMWGPSIVGFGRYAYRYESGRTGESCLAGFAVRGTELVLYIGDGARVDEALLARLGPHRMGKGCLYVRRLADLDLAVLERLVASGVASRRTRDATD